MAQLESSENDIDDCCSGGLLRQMQRRKKILLLIILNLTVQIIIIQMNTINRAALVSANNVMATMRRFTFLSHFAVANFAFHRGTLARMQPRAVWRMSRASPFVDSSIYSSHSDKEFRRRYRVSPSTFLYICSLLAPTMQKSTRGGGLPLETRVALSLNRLGTGNYLLGCADLFGMSEGMACITVLEFCDTICKVLRPLVMKKWNPESLKMLAAQFEQKHGIPYIMGAIDGSHIPIIAPRDHEPAPFYNRKGFYSVLLQGIVDVNTSFWDWDFGWAGSLHDYTMFVHSKKGKMIAKGDFAPYKLIGDAAYPFRTWSWVPFKGSKEQLEPQKAYWNFIQSSTRMCVERAFGVLKGRWRILLRRNEMQLANVANCVGACICLHNLCVAQQDFLDDTMIEEAKRWLRQGHIDTFSDLRQLGTMKILEYGTTEVSRAEINVHDLIQQAADSSVQFNGFTQEDEGALEAGVTMHRQMASMLFNKHLRETVPLPPGHYEEDSDSSNAGEN